MSDNDKKPIEYVCYMKSKEGEDDICMFINEYPNGGFKWDFLDYKPEDIENYTPIYIYRESPLNAYLAEKERADQLAHEFKMLQSGSERQRAENTALKKHVEVLNKLYKYLKELESSRCDELDEMEKQLESAREVIEFWIDFEDETIKKWGPYGSKEINACIDKARQWLEENKEG